MYVGQFSLPIILPWHTATSTSTVEQQRKKLKREVFVEQTFAIGDFLKQALRMETRDWNRREEMLLVKWDTLLGHH